MKLKVKNFNIYLDEMVLVFGILSLIFKGVRDYFENYFMCYLFIIFHELSHMFVASIFGIKTTKLSIRISGLSINLDKTTQEGRKWLLIFLAGPVSNLILAILFSNIQFICAINIALAIINLIPIYPLDGYNILKIILKIMRVKSMLKIQQIIEYMTYILLGITGGYQLIFLSNPSIILMSFYIYIQCLNIKKNDNSTLYQNCYKNITNFN